MHNTLAVIFSILITGSLMFGVNSALRVVVDTSAAQAPRPAVAIEELPEVVVRARRG